MLMKDYKIAMKNLNCEVYKMTDEMIIDYYKKGYSIEQIAHFFPSVVFGRKRTKLANDK